jgi:hypothetical protein
MRSRPHSPAVCRSACKRLLVLQRSHHKYYGNPTPDDFTNPASSTRDLRPPPRQASEWSARREALLHRVSLVLAGSGGGGGGGSGGGQPTPGGGAAGPEADAAARAERAMQELLVRSLCAAWVSACGLLLQCRQCSAEVRVAAKAGGNTTICLHSLIAIPATLAAPVQHCTVRTSVAWHILDGFDSMTCTALHKAPQHRQHRIYIGSRWP